MRMRSRKTDKEFKRMQRTKHLFPLQQSRNTYSEGIHKTSTNGRDLCKKGRDDSNIAVASKREAKRTGGGKGGQPKEGGKGGPLLGGSIP